MEKHTTTLKQNTAGGGARILTEDAVLEETIRQMIYVLAEWLEFPPHQSLTALQATFIKTLVDISGSSDILLLDSTWKAFLYPQARLFGNRQKRITDGRVLDLITSLKNHNIATPDSRENIILLEIGALHASYAPWTPSRRTDILGSAVQKFLGFLRALDPIIDSPNPLDTDTKLFQKVKSNLDFYLPFREHAPSRTRITGNLGPFQSDYIKTRSGIFSVLIYRGVTYGAPAEHDSHNNRFDNPEAWTTYYQGLTGGHLPVEKRKGEIYFSNPRAYGTPNPNRKPEQAITYWEGTANWEDFVSGEKPTFGEMLEYLLQVDDHG